MNSRNSAASGAAVAVAEAGADEAEADDGYAFEAAGFRLIDCLCHKAMQTFRIRSRIGRCGQAGIASASAKPPRRSKNARDKAKRRVRKHQQFTRVTIIAVSRRCASCRPAQARGEHEQGTEVCSCVNGGRRRVRGECSSATQPRAQTSRDTRPPTGVNRGRRCVHESSLENERATVNAPPSPVHAACTPLLNRRVQRRYLFRSELAPLAAGQVA